MDGVCVIIPVKQSMIKKDCFIRLILNLWLLRRSGVKNVLVTDSSSRLASHFLYLITRLFGYMYFKCSIDGYYSPAIVKNAAVEHLKELYFVQDYKYILFVDVDVLLPQEVIESIRFKVEGHIQFDWFPVVFLKKKYGLFAMCKYSFLGGRKYKFAQNNFEQIGYSTGIQLFQIKFYDYIGGYNQAYQGYGCEDIDMLHRASYWIGIRNISYAPHYYEDVRNHDVNKLGGFRKYFYTVKKNVSIEEMPIHFWHKRKNKSPYLRSRVLNDALLFREMKRFDLNVKK